MPLAKHLTAVKGLTTSAFVSLADYSRVSVGMKSSIH